MRKFTLILSILCMTVALSYAQGLIHFEKAKNEKANFAQSLVVDVEQVMNDAKGIEPVWQVTFDEVVPTWTFGHDVATTKDWVIGDESTRPCYWGPINPTEGTGWWILSMDKIYENLGITEGPGNYAYIDILGDRATPLDGMTLPPECEWPGTGGSGISHFDAWIQFDNLDFSSVSIPSLSFMNSYRASNPSFVDCFIGYSTDGGNTWTETRINREDELDDLNMNDGEYSLGLAGIAGQSNVSIRFRHTIHGYTGDDYNTYTNSWAWMIDDVKLYDYSTGPAHDLEVKHTVVNFFQYVDYTLPENEGLLAYHFSSHYGQIPYAQFQADSTFLWFNISLRNNGSATVTPKVNVKVYDPQYNLVFDEIVTGDNMLNYSEADTLDMIEVDCDITNPIVGRYQIIFEAYTEGNEDVTPENNRDTAYFNITENTFSRENDNLTGSMTAKYWSNGGADGDGIGAGFLVYYEDTVKSVDVFIDEATTPTALVQCEIYEYVGGNNPWSSVSQSELIEIQETDLGQWLNIDFIDDYIVEFDVDNGEKARDLLVGINLYYNGGDIYIGESTADTHSPYSCYWKFTEGQYAGSYSLISNYAGAPAIRLNYGTYTGPIVNETPLNVANQISIYPNPSTGIVNIEGIEGANVEVVNIMGQVVETIENANELNTVDMSNYSNGTYFVKVIIGNNVTTTKINLIK